MSDSCNDALHLWGALFRAQHLVLERLKVKMDAHDLTISETGVLASLLQFGDMTIGDLRDAVLLTSGSITYVIDRLVARTLVERVTCARDMRVTYVRLTDQGRQRIEAASVEFAETANDAMRGLSDPEKAVAAELLSRIAPLSPRSTESRVGRALAPEMS